MADVSESVKLVEAKKRLTAARKKLKEYQQKSRDSHPAGIITSEKKITPKLQLEEGGGSLEQNLVFDSGPKNLEHSEIGIGTSDGSKLQTFIEPSSELQGRLYEPVEPKEIDAYCSTSNDKINELNIEEANISHSGVMNEVEKNTCKGYTSSDISSFNAMPTNAFAAFPTLNMLSSNIHSSDIATARDFFDNLSSDTQSQPSNGSTDITSGIKESEQVRTVHHLFPAYSYEHLDISDELQSSVPLSIEDSNSSQSVIFLNSDNTTFQESIQVSDNKMDQSAIDNQIRSDMETNNQHETQNTSVLLSTPEHSVNARSSIESLRQLSQQMNGLIGESTEGITVHIEDSELERRNQELAAMLATELQKREQLELQLKGNQSEMCQLQLALDQLRTESEARVTRELGPVQEQLQLHVQTVGILVGEKTELQAALTKSQNVAKQKASEAEELQGRLKASRHRVMDLEKEVSSLQGTVERLEKVANELSSELDKLKLEQKMTSKRLVESDEEKLELHQKLNTKTNDCAALQQELQGKVSQLSLTQLRVQQLSTVDTSETDRQLEALHQQKVSLEKQVADLQQTVKSVGLERDQASQQYQQYVQQLNGQLRTLASKVESLNSENEQLVTREQSLVRHISEVEKQLQQQQNQKRPDSSLKLLQQDSPLLQELEAKLALTETKEQALAEKLDSQIQENQCLQREVEEKNGRIYEMESMLERFQGDQPDKDKLLAAMESDKVAAARAVGQNQRLKQQLEELQDGFVKMSNDKLELTEKLQHEQYISKEQGERLTQQEMELNDLRTQLSQKEQVLQQHASQLSNQMLHHNQIADRMRHYEEQGQLNELLQQDLEQAREHIQALSAQNGELRALLAQQVTHDAGINSGDDTISRKDEMLSTLSARVEHLELERDQMLEKLKHQEQHEEEQNSLASDIVNVRLIRDGIPKDSDSMKVAMEKLEERFTRTMKEVADLSDEKQRLEHLVLQLQGETETIGEYIALYQVQRSILRQRAQEKDEQLSKLSKDREEMRNKLSELNELVHKLVAEKESIHKMSHSIPVEHVVEKTSINYKQPEGGGVPNGEIVEVEDAVEVNKTQQIPPSGNHHPPSVQPDTAGKIMALLSEIGSSSLVDPQCSENFHPCPWCSGRLITV